MYNKSPKKLKRTITDAYEIIIMMRIKKLYRTANY